MQSKFQDKLEKIITHQQPFLLFRAPNSSHVELWQNEKLETENQFVFNNFQNSKQIIFNDSSVEQIEIESLNDDFNFELEESFLKEAISYDNYIQLIQQTIKQLQTTSTSKIVISRIKEIQNEGINLIKTFKHLHSNYPKAYVYLWYTAEDGLWIGASPELLLEEENLEIKTVSLAGTLPKDEVWTEKEIKEQKVVTDYIVDKIGKNRTIVDGPHTIDAGFFNHLKSYISAKVEDYQEVQSILAQLHPTPAVCGMPKEEAKEFILANEGYDRKYYAGYFGYKKKDKSLYFVNLRCAQIFKNVVKLYVGGGIMPDSNPEKEWKETELKSKTIGNLLVTD